MQFSNGSNLLAILFLGLTSLVLNVSSQSPSFQCIADAERPCAFCRKAKSLSQDHTASVYGVVRANAFRSDNNAAFSFNCQDFDVYGPADNAACCDQNFNLVLANRGAIRDMSPEAFDRHCTVIAT